MEIFVKKTTDICKRLTLFIHMFQPDLRRKFLEHQHLAQIVCLFLINCDRLCVQIHTVKFSRNCNIIHHQNQFQCWIMCHRHRLRRHLYPLLCRTTFQRIQRNHTIQSQRQLFSAVHQNYIQIDYRSIHQRLQAHHKWVAYLGFYAEIKTKNQFYFKIPDWYIEHSIWCDTKIEKIKNGKTKWSKSDSRSSHSSSKSIVRFAKLPN